MSETRGTATPRKGGPLLVIIALAVLVIGAVVLGLGVSASGSADDDLAEAEAALEAAEDDLADAEDDREAAEGEVEAAAEAEAILADARTAARAIGEVCDCDEQVTQIIQRIRTAANAGDEAGVNAALDELNAQADRRNAARDELDAL